MCVREFGASAAQGLAFSTSMGAGKFDPDASAALAGDTTMGVGVVIGSANLIAAAGL